MATSSMVQARIDSSVKERAAEVLEGMGLTISDAVRILLTRTAKEGSLPFELTHDSAAHDAWFKAKVLEALADQRAAIPNEDVKAHFAQRRAATERKAE